MPVIAEPKSKRKLNPAPATTFSPQEAQTLFEQTAQQYMGVSGEEFLRSWDRGDYSDSKSRSRVMRVAALIPLVRKTRARKKSR